MSLSNPFPSTLSQWVLRSFDPTKVAFQTLKIISSLRLVLTLWDSRIHLCPSIFLPVTWAFTSQSEIDSTFFFSLPTTSKQLISATGVQNSNPYFIVAMSSELLTTEHFSAMLMRLGRFLLAWFFLVLDPRAPLSTEPQGILTMDDWECLGESSLNSKLRLRTSSILAVRPSFASLVRFTSRNLCA